MMSLNVKSTKYRSLRTVVYPASPHHRHRSITAGFPFINVTVFCNPPLSAHTSLSAQFPDVLAYAKQQVQIVSPPDASISLVSFTVIFLTALSNALNKGFPTTSAAPTSNVTGSASSSSCKICPSLVRKLNVISTMSPSFGNASSLLLESFFVFPLLILISVVNPSCPLRTSCKMDPENASGPASARSASESLTTSSSSSSRAARHNRAERFLHSSSASRGARRKEEEEDDDDQTVDARACDATRIEIVSYRACVASSIWRHWIKSNWKKIAFEASLLWHVTTTPARYETILLRNKRHRNR